MLTSHRTYILQLFRTVLRSFDFTGSSSWCTLQTIIIHCAWFFVFVLAFNPTVLTSIWIINADGHMVSPIRFDQLDRYFIIVDRVNPSSPIWDILSWTRYSIENIGNWGLISRLTFCHRAAIWLLGITSVVVVLQLAR